jgi:hypothetical protein
MARPRNACREENRSLSDNLIQSCLRGWRGSVRLPGREEGLEALIARGRFVEDSVGSATVLNTNGVIWRRLVA